MNDADSALVSAAGMQAAPIAPDLVFSNVADVGTKGDSLAGAVMKLRVECGRDRSELTGLSSGVGWRLLNEISWAY